MLEQMKRFTRLFHAAARSEELQARLDSLRAHTPVPVFWLLGKTQSGKTSIIKYLTGADEAEIGRGFRPCTKTSRQYQFPTEEAPLLTFLDTRGIDEAGYDVTDDLARFDGIAHVVIVTVKALDHAQEHILEHLRRVRQARPERPIVLAASCLHEAYPQQEHVQPYPFSHFESKSPVIEPGVALPPQLASLAETLDEQQRRFAPLVDWIVPIDLTRPEEGYDQPDYGGAELKHVLLEVLPAAYRQTLLTLDDANQQLSDLYARHAMPHIVGYSSLAATAGAFPIPWVDLLVLPGIQTRMVYHLAKLYGQPLSGRRFTELASTLGLGIMFRQAAREIVKVIPYVGSVANGVLAAASTFALGKAFCFYYSAVQKGHVPSATELRRYYHAELTRAEGLWRK